MEFVTSLLQQRRDILDAVDDPFRSADGKYEDLNDDLIANLKDFGDEQVANRTQEADEILDLPIMTELKDLDEGLKQVTGYDIDPLALRILGRNRTEYGVQVRQSKLDSKANAVYDELYSKLGYDKDSTINLTSPPKILEGPDNTIKTRLVSLTIGSDVIKKAIAEYFIENILDGGRKKIEEIATTLNQKNDDGFIFTPDYIKQLEGHIKFLKGVETFLQKILESPEYNKKFYKSLDKYNMGFFEEVIKGYEKLEKKLEKVKNTVDNITTGLDSCRNKLGQRSYIEIQTLAINLVLDYGVNPNVEKINGLLTDSESKFTNVQDNLSTLNEEQIENFNKILTKELRK